MFEFVFLCLNTNVFLDIFYPPNDIGHMVDVSFRERLE